jgi:hypothetical protein
MRGKTRLPELVLALGHACDIATANGLIASGVVSVQGRGTVTEFLINMKPGDIVRTEKSEDVELVSDVDEVTLDKCSQALKESVCKHCGEVKFIEKGNAHVYCETCQAERLELQDISKWEMYDEMVRYFVRGPLDLSIISLSIVNKNIYKMYFDNNHRLKEPVEWMMRLNKERIDKIKKFYDDDVIKTQKEPKKEEQPAS